VRSSRSGCSADHQRKQGITQCKSMTQRSAGNSFGRHCRLPGAMAIPGIVAPSRNRREATQGQTLTALVYSGINENTWRKFFVPQFEAATGAKVVIDAAWTEGIAKLKTPPPARLPSTC